MTERTKPNLKGMSPDNLRQWQASFSNSLYKALAIEANGQAGAGTYSGLARHYRNLAMIAYYLDEPLEKVREHLTHSAEYTLKLFRLAVSGEQSVDPSYVRPYGGARGIACALIPGCWDTASGIAWAMRYLKERDKPQDHVYNNLYGWMMMHLVLEEDESAAAMAQAILDHRRKTWKKYYTPLARMGLALVRRDAEGLATALEDYLVVHDRLAKWGSYRDSEEGMMCFPGMAFYVLAQRRGVPLSVKSPYLFLDLLV